MPGAIITKIDGALASPAYPVDAPIVSTRGALYALYALGNAWHPAGQAVTTDLSGNGRTLTATGTPVLGDYAATCSNVNYYSCPFTLANLLTRTGKATFAVIKKSDRAATRNLITTSAGTPSFSLTDGGASFGASAVTNDGTNARQATVPLDAARDTRFEMIVSRLMGTAITAGRGFGTTIAQPAGTSFTAQSISGTGTLRLGANSSGTTHEMAMVAMFDDWLTDAEVWTALLTADEPAVFLAMQEWFIYEGGTL